MPSSLCLGASADVGLSKCLGVDGGNMHQRLCPEINAFHALVPNGSIWNIHRIVYFFIKFYCLD